MKFAGVITHDQSLKASLLALFETFQKMPRDPAKLIERLLTEAWYYEQFKEEAKKEPTPDIHRKKVDRFRRAIQEARKAWIDLPPVVRQVMPSHIPFTGTSLLSKPVLEALMLEGYWSKDHQLPDWRKAGLEEIEEWGADLEMLDLLQALAEQAICHQPDKSARKRTDIGFIRGIAGICEEYGIKKSAAEESQLTKVVRVMLRGSKADLRDAIRTAIS